MLNNCIIMGRLTADPELRHTNSGVACCRFTLAVERDGKPNEQTGQRAADFIDCTAWRNTAEFICKWFSKGRVAVAAGRMQTRTWKDRHDQSRKSTELQVESMYFADIALISSMLWGGCMAFMVFFSACGVCGCKLCHSLFKLCHILSVVRNQSRFFLCLPEQQHIQQLFHMGLLL